MQTQENPYVTIDELKLLMKDVALRFQETDKQIKETDKQIKETNSQIKETDKKFDRLFGKIHELDRNWGKLVEALVAPSVAEQFRQHNIPIIGSYQRVERQVNNQRIEIDILLKNKNVLIAVEVKTTLRVENVNEHISKHLMPFKTFFPEYSDHKVLGAMAYIHVEENADRYAYKKGLYVLTFSEGNIVEIKNDTHFVPNEW